MFKQEKHSFLSRESGTHAGSFAGKWDTVVGPHIHPLPHQGAQQYGLLGAGPHPRGRSGLGLLFLLTAIDLGMTCDPILANESSG